MKTKKLSKKLTINKSTISNLGNLDKVHGGQCTGCHTECGTCETDCNCSLQQTCYTPAATCYYSCGGPASCNGGPC